MGRTKIQWDLQGFSWYTDELAKLGVHFDDAVKEALDESAKPMEEDMRLMVPVRTGTLRSAIEAHPTRQDGIASFTKTIGVDYKAHSGAFYAGMVEFGTAHSAARPFIWPAYEKNRVRAFRIMGAVLERWLREYGFR